MGPCTRVTLACELLLKSRQASKLSHSLIYFSTLPVVADWIPTLENLGVPGSPDPSGGQSWGAFIATSAINPANWTRSYSRAAYIDPLPPRPNLDILPNATVTQIIFDDNLTAIAVQFATVKGGPVTTINVRKEVILAAGAIGSPNILMHSGVGPKDILTAAGVPVKLDLQGVGQHLQDHIVRMITPCRPSHCSQSLTPTFRAPVSPSRLPRIPGPPIWPTVLLMAFLTDSLLPSFPLSTLPLVTPTVRISWVHTTMSSRSNKPFSASSTALYPISPARTQASSKVTRLSTSPMPRISC